MIVSWMTTNRCNLKCVHCYQDAGQAHPRELKTDEAKTMIEQIAKAGFKIMIFSGGEPLMRPDIFELVAHAAGQGLRPVFGTNGMRITPRVAAQLKESGAAAMGISLDSLDPKKHDWFRGVPRAYELTMKGIENCKAVGLPFQLHTTVVDWNQDEVCDITDFAEQIGAQAHYVFFLIPVGRGVFIEDTSLEVIQNEKLLRDLMAKDKVTEQEIMFAVAGRGYYPGDTPIKNYDPSFISGVLVAAWAQVFAMVEANRQSTPF
jgi:MoaA/NifB/PqqE/SkfB family radical SAM enzyme